MEIPELVDRALEKLAGEREISLEAILWAGEEAGRVVEELAGQKS